MDNLAKVQDVISSDDIDMGDLHEIENMSNEELDSLFTDEGKPADASDNEMDASIAEGMAELDKAEKAEEGVEAAPEKVEDKKSEVDGEVQAKEEVEEGGEAVSETFEIQVDGKTEKVTLQELKNEYSGKKYAAREISKIDVERKGLETQLKGIQDYMNELGNTMKNKSVLDGVYKLGEMQNIAPHLIKEALIRELVPEIDRIQGLSEEEIDFEKQKSQFNYDKQRQESDLANLKKEQASNDLRTKIDSIREAQNIDAPEWDDAVTYLDTHLPQAENITPKRVEDYVLYNRAKVKTETSLKSFEDGKYLNDETIVKDLHKVIVDNPDLDSADIQHVLNTAFGNATKTQVEDKLKGVVEKSDTIAKSGLVKELEDESFEDYEDFDKY